MESTTPLGATVTKRGVTFALYAPSAAEVTLVLPHRKVPLQKKGATWEVEVEGVGAGVPYTYTLDGRKGLLDPYALAFVDTECWSRKGAYRAKALVVNPPPFDWQGVTSPGRPLSDLIVYELHVRAFTASAPVAHPGTFLGLVERLPYLQQLGINAIELLPIFEFDPYSYKGHHPKTGERLKNFWGYGSLGFFAPMSGYASVDPIGEFKTLVRECHRAGIEVILDVVYNHTGDGPHALSPDHYILDNGVHTNYSGCGNTLSPNTQPTQTLILDSLRYWSREMGVDGFRFDLASILTRGDNGEILDDPPLLAAIRADPLLSKVKLIAEPWDLGTYQLGQFPRWGPWSEWNGAFRDTARRFLKGADGLVAPFASSLLGSPQIYPSTSPVNFVTSHDGFTLTDLVSYNDKHNQANGEGNRDGSSHNDSWNCGVEGPTDDPAILSLRARQKRNHLLALLIARGLPMIQMGDEVSQTKKGNNNTWCQDNALSYFPWDKQDEDLLRFTQGLIAFRKANPGLTKGPLLWEVPQPLPPELSLPATENRKVIAEMWKRLSDLWSNKRGKEPKQVILYGPDLGSPNWGRRFIALALNDLYIAFNASWKRREVRLPPGKPWLRIADTALHPPHDFSPDGEAFPLDPAHPYEMESYSALLLKRG
ncbi:MAG: glycogen-debranching protein [Parachlamydiales bacterium]